MVIHNEKFASRQKIWKTISVILVISLCVSVPLLYRFLQEFDIRITPLSSGECCLYIAIIIGLYSIFVFFRQRQNLYFIYISDEDKQNLVFRFYKIQLLMGKCTSYKIPFDSFPKYEIATDGKTKNLILYQKMNKNQMAKYPPISLNALKEEDIQQIKDLLNKYC